VVYFVSECGKEGIDEAILASLTISRDHLLAQAGGNATHSASGPSKEYAFALSKVIMRSKRT